MNKLIVMSVFRMMQGVVWGIKKPDYYDNSRAC